MNQTVVNQCPHHLSTACVQLCMNMRYLFINKPFYRLGQYTTLDNYDNKNYAISPMLIFVNTFFIAVFSFASSHYIHSFIRSHTHTFKSHVVFGKHARSKSVWIKCKVRTITHQNRYCNSLTTFVSMSRKLWLFFFLFLLCLTSSVPYTTYTHHTN